MATRLARALSPYSVKRSTAEISSGVSRPRSRWASSSSSKKMNNTSDRLSGVIDAVNERNLPPELRGQRNSVRSETDIQGVVEQRIWHSMEEGQLENLPGKGKPVNLNTNPPADPEENTLYRILSKNGCAPEWVQLNKDIRTQVSEWRLALNRAWDIKRGMGRLVGVVAEAVAYNLIVRFGRQMSGLNWEKEVARLEE
ncbi:hypothetical protein Ddye_008085 [Dipteronia dyeriana]|uniref:DnaJ homologue subfamily C member 28 conserved domain-containing protein n=1 Tax=Dipteronia dyeriana TaxID=168575 RepID=A0AAE0CLK3_9ROSI|nr:hypothetical protein Ddye_008085 [Dipteronia dyeriana]